MNFLLDTHSFLWWCANDSKLSPLALNTIADIDNNIYLSVVSAWEISIKSRIGKLLLPEKPDAFIAKMLQQHSFSVLAITINHALKEHDLPNHHNDPFDRLLISQALVEDLSLISNDRKITNYDLKILW